MLRFAGPGRYWRWRYPFHPRPTCSVPSAFASSPLLSLLSQRSCLNPFWVNTFGFLGRVVGEEVGLDASCVVVAGPRNKFFEQGFLFTSLFWLENPKVLGALSLNLLITLSLHKVSFCPPICSPAWHAFWRHVGLRAWGSPVMGKCKEYLPSRMDDSHRLEQTASEVIMSQKFTCPSRLSSATPTMLATTLIEGGPDIVGSPARWHMPDRHPPHGHATEVSSCLHASTLRMANPHGCEPLRQGRPLAHPLRRVPLCEMGSTVARA